MRASHPVDACHSNFHLSDLQPPTGVVDCVSRWEMAMKTLMETYRRQMDRQKQKGGIGWVLLWLLGVPIPVLVVLFLLRGCT
jgi:hypothetical protein